MHNAITIIITAIWHKNLTNSLNEKLSNILIVLLIPSPTDLKKLRITFLEEVKSFTSYIFLFNKSSSPQLNILQSANNLSISG